MKTISTSEMPGMKFSVEDGTKSFRCQSNKIGWITAKADKPGTKYDIVIKDVHGRERHRMNNCGSQEGTEYGEMINMNTHIGEEFEVSVENIKGGKSVDLFIN